MNPFIKTTRDISKEIQLLIDATATMERGAFISHDQITEATQIARDAPEHNRLIHKWKRAMRSRGLWIKAAQPRGTGYRILTLDEQRIEEPIRLQKQGMRRIDMAAACLGSIPVEVLDETGVRFQSARLSQLAAIKGEHQTQQAQIASWLSNPKTLPRIARE